MVQITQPTGVELNAYLILDNKITRQEIKLKTLSKYVQQHPQGWKKRLELAELLYAISRWDQAVDEYRQVLKRQPHLIGVRLQLGNQHLSMSATTKTHLINRFISNKRLGLQARYHCR